MKNVKIFVSKEELLKKANKPAQDAMKLHPFYKGKVEISPKCCVRNIDDLKKVGQHNVAVIGNIGLKSKIHLARVMVERKVHAHGINLAKFLTKIDKRIAKKNNGRKTENKQTEKKAEAQKQHG